MSETIIGGDTPRKKTKRITLEVDVRYTVCQEFDVPEDVYDQLCDAYDNNHGDIDTDKHSSASDWLADHIEDDDAQFGCEYNISEIADEDE